jgi:AcrR family transcriptional regulator
MGALMSTAAAQAEPRVPLSRERIFRAAIALADREGIEAVTMRNLAQALGVEAMSLYYHVANKEALLDGVVDALIEEIGEELGGFDFEAGPDDWKSVLRARILTARVVMLRHRWAPAVIESRTSMTPTLLRYMDTVGGIMVEGGFSYDLVHHAMHAMGSLALGFNQELFAPADPSQDDADTQTMLQDLAPQLPYIVAMLAEVTHEGPETTIGWCDDQTEFEFTLDLMLDGLERLLASS